MKQFKVVTSEVVPTPKTNQSKPVLKVCAESDGWIHLTVGQRIEFLGQRQKRLEAEIRKHLMELEAIDAAMSATLELLD